MANIVLTNKNRTIGLPVNISELKDGELIVATNANMGMLYVEEKDGKEILKDYDDLKEDDIPDGIPISLPLISDYKNKRIEDLYDELNQLNTIEGD